MEKIMFEMSQIRSFVEREDLIHKSKNGFSFMDQQALFQTCADNPIFKNFLDIYTELNKLYIYSKREKNINYFRKIFFPISIFNLRLTWGCER
ncbi:hypothetical protein BpHYR1_000069 [Brachionus plicatilis]|uniref:Uncharacterized protein n=1 Tax=Brachionus plicatilis TaxID=10195 RepID=A0A3M7SFB5_BRAPC|nr:hypothetical protein BpHYR1_000069 [Brachionus plicatilis]